MRARWTYAGFVVNNPKQQIEPDKWPHKPLYVVWQLEEAPTTKTPHYQGYAVWNKQVALSGKKKCLPRANWKARRGTHEQCKEYHMKSETRIEGPWEYGSDADVPRKAGQRTDLEAFVHKVQKRKRIPERELLLEHTTIVAKYPKFVNRVHREFAPKRNWVTNVILLVGTTGVGKSMLAHSLMESGHFGRWFKVPHAKGSGLYFDGYDGEECVLLDEFDGNRCPPTFLNDLTDRYSMSVPQHGRGNVNFVARTIIICSNFVPKDWWKGEKHKPFMRRVSLAWFKAKPQPKIDGYASITNKDL